MCDANLKSTLRLVAMFVLASLAVVGAPARSAAQVSNLDITTLIEGMRAEGMNELLLHLVETENFTDPVLKQQVRINQYLLAQDRFNELAGKAATPAQAVELRQQGAEQFDLALDARRQLIADYFDHEQRPIWQTQLAMQLLGEYLEGMNQNASQFYEFGVPTIKQREAYEKAVVEALTQLEQADVRFFELQTRLAQEPDHTAKRIDTGLWARMMDQFYALRTQYALAQARYYAWLLPDTSAYFSDLTGKFPRQRKTIAEERTRLLAETKEVLERLIATRADANNIGDGTRSLLGRVIGAQGQPDQAMPLIEQAIAYNQPTLVDIEARLGKAFILAQKKRDSEAMLTLDQLSTHGLVTSNLLVRLLVTDARHRILLAKADQAPAVQKTQAVAAAYQPYLDLLEDPALGASANSLRNYIQQRWAASISPTTNLSQVPALVAAAMAQMLRSEGQNLMNQASQLRSQGEESQADAKDREAAPKLERSLAIANNLLNRTELSPAARSNAMYEKALSIYFANKQDVSKLIEAATILSDLAEQLPDQPRAPDALTSAMGGILHPLFAQQISQAGPPYERAMKLMLEKFPDLPATHNERLFYSVTILAPQDAQDRIIEVLTPLPSNHPDYFLSRQQIVRSQLAKIIKAEPAQRAAMAQPVLQFAQDVLDEANRAQGGAAGDEATAIQQVAGAVRIMRSDLLTLSGQAALAIAELQNFEQDYVQYQDLIREALGKRILLQAATGDLASVRREAAQMMASFPDDAAPVIDQVLTGLDNQIEALRQAIVNELVSSRKEALQKQVTDISGAAEQLARMLVDWALAKGFNEDEMLPFQLVLAKSMRLAGKAEESVQYMLPLYRKYPSDLDVLSQTGEALVASGSKEHLTEAGTIFNTIIGGVPPENNVYPAVWWNAWMRRMQIMDRLSEQTDQITLRVRQLEMTDPELGGEPYKSELKRLALKHGR